VFRNIKWLPLSLDKTHDRPVKISRSDQEEKEKIVFEEQEKGRKGDNA